ncbi:VirB2 family type IV secretion system major pilin TrwL [Bartonella sp. CB178]|uniref:VirB2 family type IV secretion system major pilin TrwL n=1 Tax=Bartonella sp. CB178 TaxID=3112255 RepID=UPI00300E17D2
MKSLKFFQSMMRFQIVVVSMVMVAFPVYAQAANDTKRLKTAENALKALKDDLSILVPIAAAVILICLAVSYAGRFIDKSTFLRWSVGVIVAGSAWELAGMLFAGK